MDPLANPYTPNAGARPPALVGRDRQIADFELLIARLSRGHTEKSMIIAGLRGVGKTVLLGRFRQIAEDAHWAVIEWEISKHDDTAFRRTLATQFRTALLTMSPRHRWQERANRAANVLRSFTLSVDPEGHLTAGLGAPVEDPIANSGDLLTDLTHLIVAVGEAAQEADRGVVMLLDEVQFLSAAQLESLISALHKSVQRALPVTLVGAGLPQVAQLAGEAKSYAERLFTFPVIGNLTHDQAHHVLQQPTQAEGAQWHQDALALATDLTDNYPFFLQDSGTRCGRQPPAHTSPQPTSPRLPAPRRSQPGPPTTPTPQTPQGQLNTLPRALPGGATANTALSPSPGSPTSWLIPPQRARWTQGRTAVWAWLVLPDTPGGLPG